MSRHRIDPETGATYVYGGLYGVRTLDDRRSDDEEFAKVLERRASLFTRPTTFRRRLGLFLSESESIEQTIRRRMSEVPARRVVRRETRSAQVPALPKVSAVSKGFRGMLQAILSFDYMDLTLAASTSPPAGHSSPRTAQRSRFDPTRSFPPNSVRDGSGSPPTCSHYSCSRSGPTLLNAA